MKSPTVGIIMGSKSDLRVMSEAAMILQEFRVPVEVNIVSAHRTPRWMAAYASGAARRGIRVIIAGAGGAAHLPGMVASLSTLPVIGVPIASSNSLRGLDSLLSIVQMPAGIPVATVAVNGAKNAGILAAEIIGTSDAAVARRMTSFKKKLRNTVLKDVRTLRSAGYRKFLKRLS